MSSDEVVITDAEWQASLIGARLLRAAARGFRALGDHETAAGWDGHADALEGLACRATVAATRDHQAGENDLEAER
ncbi:MAG TPA: hypothetical protein VOB72_17690 [Candidatus Dormibacteraeota bacterium]|nr:hypothetical protein [Candidatus Dormibacteraeota bacterium]